MISRWISCGFNEFYDFFSDFTAKAISDESSLDPDKAENFTAKSITN